MPEMFFKGQGVVALTSDASLDFTPADFDLPLTDAQRTYLKKYTNHDIFQVFWRKQVHGDAILETPSPPGGEEADAFITAEKNVPIAIRTADCVPVFIFDPTRRAIGLAHAGWKGTHKHIAAKVVQKMQQTYQSRPADLKIVLGPSIRSCCYQVGPEFREHFPSHVSQRPNGLYVDIVAANRDQLIQAGIIPKNIFDSGLCTCCNKHYFSFRRDGSKAGRMISLMMLL
jgi:YfiH family protein